MNILDNAGLKLGDVYERETDLGTQTFVVIGEGISATWERGDPRVFLWFTPAPRNRLNPDPRIVDWDPASVVNLTRKMIPVQRTEFVPDNILERG